MLAVLAGVLKVLPLLVIPFFLRRLNQGRMGKIKFVIGIAGAGMIGEFAFRAGVDISVASALHKVGFQSDTTWAGILGKATAAGIAGLFVGGMVGIMLLIGRFLWRKWRGKHNPKGEVRKPEDSPPLSEPATEGGGMNRAFYGFVIAIVVLAGAIYHTAFYEPQSQMNVYVPQGGVKERDEYGWTPLMRAAFYGQTEAIRALLKIGADIEARESDGWTALMLATQEGQTEAIKALLKAGADVNARESDGWTALMEAAYKGQTGTMGVLLKAGADIEARDNGGWTALMLAVRFGHTEAVRKLLKAGADTKARNDVGKTAFDWWQNYKNHPNFKEISDLLRP